jgi:hypothetical protein
MEVRMKPLIGILIVAASVSPVNAQETTTNATTAPYASVQRTLPLAAGARIRIRVEPDTFWRVGRLVGTPPDTVKFQACDKCTVVAFPLSALNAVDVSLGNSSSAPKGSVFGALAGGAAGFLLGSYIGRGCRDGPCVQHIVLVPFGSILGFFLGGAAGSVNRHEDWQPVPIPAWK